MTDAIPLFQPNNHSNPRIQYRPAPSADQRQLVALIDDRYDIGGIISVDVLVTGAGLNTTSYKVWGARDRLFVQRHADADSRKLALQRQVIRHCKAHGVHVPEPIRTQDGEEFAQTEQGLTSAYRFLPGSHYQGSLAELRAAGIEVARMHQAFRSLPSTETIAQAFALPTKPYDETLIEFLRTHAPHDDAIDRFFSEHEALITETVRAVRASTMPRDRQIIHHDLHPHNFLFEDGTLNAILDFGEMQHDSVLKDVAYAIHRLGRQYVVAENILSQDAIRRAAATARDTFIEAYTSSALLQDKDIHCIPIMMQHIGLEKFRDLTIPLYANNIPLWRQELPKYGAILLEAEYFR
jgi:Ser/Thr protein kinase RdoA (MazF antagonist)